MPEDEDIAAFVEKVVLMRGKQRLFFKTRNYITMSECKALEREVDEMASGLQKRLRKAVPAGQQELWGQ